MRPPITSWLVDALYFQPDFHQAYRLPEGTAHAVDFGAGGISDIGPLTARDLGGRGVPVIADAEFY